MEKFEIKPEIKDTPELSQNIEEIEEVLKEYSNNPENFENFSEIEQEGLKNNLNKIMNGFLVLTGGVTVMASAGGAFEKALEVAQNNDMFFETSGGVLRTGIAMTIITALGVYEGFIGAKELLKNKKNKK